MCATSAIIRSGSAASRSTPNGASVSRRTAAISWIICSDSIAAAPSVPIPPASLTAATSRWYDTPPIPANITGCSIRSRSVNLVRMCSSPVLGDVEAGFNHPGVPVGG